MKLLMHTLLILFLFLQSGNLSAGKEILSADNVIWTISEVSTQARTYYDFQSYGVPRYIWQEPNNQFSIHAVFMRDPYGNPGFPNTGSIYFYSSNGGQYWDYLGMVCPGNSGFPAVTALNDGRGVILTQTQYSISNVRIQLFVDLVSGIGVFIQLDPGPVRPSVNLLWGTGISTADDKIVFLGSADSVYRNTCTNVNPPGTYSGYRSIPGADGNNKYSIARYQNKIGIAYITGSQSQYPAGSVFFTESNDNGISWGTPVQIWNTNYSTDSIGGFRGVDVAYLGTSPKVLFDLCKRSVSSNYPNMPSKIMFWSPDVNAGIPALIDSAAGLNGSNPVHDEFNSVCRGVIGACSINYLFTAWCRARNDTDAAGSNYFDIYFSYSVNGGVSWNPRLQATNISGPLRDCRYVSISPYNAFESFHLGTANLIFQSDSVPGSFVNGAGKSLARMMYCKVVLDTLIVGIENGTTGIPERFVLYQNYPNPFNPSTTIEYGLSKSADVTLRVYDITGKEIKTLVEGYKSAGYHSSVFETTGLASGVYFCRIEISDGNKIVFTEAKKMLLVK